jgi:hypothetical protein
MRSSICALEGANQRPGWASRQQRVEAFVGKGECERLNSLDGDRFVLF